MSSVHSHTDLLDKLLKRPSSIANSIRAMAQHQKNSRKESSSLSQQEAQQLLDDIDETTYDKTHSAGPSTPNKLTIRGEGTSGNKRQSDLVVQSKEMSPMDVNPAMTDEVLSEQSFNHQFDIDNEPKEALRLNQTIYSNPTDEMIASDNADGSVSQQDLTDLADVLEQRLEEKMSNIKVIFNTEIAKQQHTIKTLQTVVSDISREVSDLRIQLNKMAAKSQSIIAPAAAPVDVSITSRMSSPTKSPRLSVCGNKNPSSDRIDIVAEFLKLNGAFPKVKAVRRAKLKQLSQKLQFELPTRDISPIEWNQDQLLSFFSSS